MLKQLSEEIRKQMLDAADIWWQDIVHDFVWIKNGGLSMSYTPICSWAMFKADLTGSYKAAELLNYENSKKLYGDTEIYKTNGYLFSFRNYLENMTSLSSVEKEIRDKFTDDQVLMFFTALASAGCHGSLQTDWDKLPYAIRPNQVKTGSVEDFMVTSCADYEPEKHHRQKVIDFLLGPKSPYKQLLDCGFFCHYYKDGRIAGVTIFIEDVPEELRHNIKNFFIALRQARERPKFADTFAAMVDEGTDPRVAFLAAHEVSKLVTPSGNNDQYSVTSTTHHNGGHWPLSMVCDSGFSVTRFFNGDINIPLGAIKRQTAYGPVNASVNSTFADSPENNLKAADWIKALTEGADGGGSKTLYSTSVNPKYKSLKRLAEVATNFLVSKGAVL